MPYRASAMLIVCLLCLPGSLPATAQHDDRTLQVAGISPAAISIGAGVLGIMHGANKAQNEKLAAEQAAREAAAAAERAKREAEARFRSWSQTNSPLTWNRPFNPYAGLGGGGAPSTSDLFLRTPASYRVYRLGAGWGTNAPYCISFVDGFCSPCDYIVEANACMARPGERTLNIRNARFIN